MIFSILFGRVPGLQQKTIGFLPIDVATQETITFDSEVTEHPIETGGVVSDHIYNRPTGLRITGTVRSELKAVAYQILQTLHEQRQPIFVVTGLQTFTDMAITSLIIPRDWRNASALEFNAEFRELEFVSSASAPAPVSASPSAADTASSTNNAGQTQTRPASEASTVSAEAIEQSTGGAGATSRTSILKSITGGLF